MRPNSVKKLQRALLRHDQEFAVGVVEVVGLHRLRDEIHVRGHAGLRVDVARRGHGAHAREERQLLLRDRHGAPAQLPDRPVMLGRRRRGLPIGQRRLLELRRVLHGGADAVEPGALVGAARRREGRARQLLGIEAVGRALRRVLADGERAGQGFGLEVVAEARHVAGRRRLGPLHAVRLGLGLAAACSGLAAVRHVGSSAVLRALPAVLGLSKDAPRMRLHGSTAR